MGGILGDNLGEGNCESKIASRQWGDIFAARHQSVSQGPLEGGKIHKKIPGSIQIGIWEFRGQNPHCKDPALIISNLIQKLESGSVTETVTVMNSEKMKSVTVMRAEPKVTHLR